jgi:hypothetical protein
MREIKFRCYDKQYKEMINDIQNSDEFWLILQNSTYKVMQYTRTKR